MAKRKTILLVDDQPDEIERVRNFLGGWFNIAAGTTIDGARAELRAQGRKRPDLCLVDLYYPEGPTDSPDPQKELNEARANLLKAEASYYETLAKLRQTTDRGFRNLEQLRAIFRLRRVPIAFFTRKGTLDNAISAYEHSPVTSVIKKPDPAPKLAR